MESTEERRPHRSQSDEEGGEESEGGRFGGGMMRRPRVCQFCVDKNKTLDYKNTELLRNLVNDQGKIRPRRQTGTCARHQRLVALAVKRARHMALLPFSGPKPQ